MVNLSQKRIDEIFSKLKDKKIAVIGDLMIDRYFLGTVARLSPEAPVPVVEVKEESNRLGGAANVANNMASSRWNPNDDRRCRQRSGSRPA